MTVIRRVILAAGFAFASAVISPAGAQNQPGDLDISGRVLLRIYTVIHDQTQFGHALKGVALQIRTPSGSVVPIRTDASGIANAWLARGQYRVSTVTPAVWSARKYAWDQSVDVRPAMPLLELNEGNASSIADASAIDANPAIATEPITNGPVRPEAAPGASRKDPALATVLSLLIPGVGQMYAGAPGKGALYLVTDLAATGAILYGISCNSKFSCNGGSCTQFQCTDGNRGTSWIVSGALLSALNTVVAMVDAHGTANRYNQEHGLASALRNARPMLAVGSRESRIGLTLPLQ